MLNKLLGFVAGLLVDLVTLLELFALRKLTEKLKWSELELRFDAVMAVQHVLLGAHFVYQEPTDNLNE